MFVLKWVANASASVQLSGPGPGQGSPGSNQRPWAHQDLLDSLSTKHLSFMRVLPLRSQ